jgi:hypothetical protein
MVNEIFFDFNRNEAVERQPLFFSGKVNVSLEINSVRKFR